MADLPPEEREPSAPEAEAERDTLQQRIAAAVEIPLALLALIWVILVVVELAVPVSPEASRRITQVSLAIWFIFALDVAVEFTVAPDKVRYIRANVLPILSVILPFLRVARLVRLVAVLRSVSLVRIALVTNRASLAIAEVFSEHRIQYVLALTLLVVVMGAAGAFFFEQGAAGTAFVTFGDSLWWAATLVTTVNVGVDPVTFEARLIALVLRGFGMAVFGYIAGSIASYLVGRRVARPAVDEARGGELTRLAREVERLREQVERMARTIERSHRGRGEEPK